MLKGNWVKFFQFVFVEKAENLGVANLCCSENVVLGAEVLREACRGTLGGGRSIEYTGYDCG